MLWIPSPVLSLRRAKMGAEGRREEIFMFEFVCF
jgi:hypothetical protein